MVAANQVGEHPGGHHSGGNSMIVDPWGAVLARAGGESPGYVVAELDFDRQDDIRKRVPLMEHRRPKLYHRSSAQTHTAASNPDTGDIARVRSQEDG
jgi:predicted amidohydrolase